MNLDERNDTVQESSEMEVEVDIAIEKSKLTKINNDGTRESTHYKIINKGVAKMKLIHLPTIRHRRNNWMAGEQVAIRDSIYNNVININKL